MSAHPIVHIEFSAKDPEAAGTFYAELFGWQVASMPDFDYVTFNSEGGPGGGFVRVSDEGHVAYRPGDVIAYIGTDNIEATLAKAEALGGKTLLGKTEIPNIGWFAIFADPTGNRVGLFTGKG